MRGLDPRIHRAVHAGVTMDRKANAAFYGSAGMTPGKIFTSSPNIAPDIANTFVQILTAQTRRLPTQPGMDTETVSSSAQDRRTVPDRDSEVRTFGIPEPEYEKQMEELLVQLALKNQQIRAQETKK